MKDKFIDDIFNNSKEWGMLNTGAVITCIMEEVMTLRGMLKEMLLLHVDLCCKLNPELNQKEILERMDQNVNDEWTRLFSGIYDKVKAEDQSIKDLETFRGLLKYLVQYHGIKRKETDTD